MSNYTKSTNFTAKDSLPTGDTNKVIRGSEFDTEFNAIQTAVGTKADLAGPTFTGTATFDGITATGIVNFTGGSVTTNIDGGTIDGVTIGGTTAGAGTFSSLTATTGTFSGAVTGSNLNVSNWDTAYGWGDHGVEGYLTSVAFSDIDAGAVTLSSETFVDSDTQIPTNAAVIDYVAATIPLITEVNDLSSVVTWANVPDANITESSVTQHQAALSINTSQISGGLSLTDITDVTATATEVNTLDGITATTAELNYTDGVTSNIQTQLDSKVGASYTGDVDITGELLVDSYNETFKKVSSVSAVSGYQLGSFAYDSKSLSVSSQITGPSSLEFNDDGTILYVVGLVNDAIYQYTLTTPYDVSTGSYASKSFSIASQETTPFALTFKSDGTKFYLAGFTNDTVYQYSLSTAWDISTASYDSVSFSVLSVAPNPADIRFKSDGTKMYVLSFANGAVYQYSLSTAWDISTASYDSKTFSVNSQATNPRGLFLSPDGTTMVIFEDQTNPNPDLFRYTLSTAYDISTASYDSVSAVSTVNETNPQAMILKPDGSKIYIVGNQSLAVFQYSISATTYSTTFDCENANVFETVLDGNTTVAFINPPAAGTATDSTAYAMSLKVVQDSGASGYTVTWPTSVDWPSATAPTLTATASAVDQFVFYTYDGGTTWYGFTAGQALG